MDRETRELSFDDLELRADVEDDGVHIRGMAAVFNKKSVLLWGFREIIKPGAFKNAIKRADVLALFNHDPNIVLGRTKAKTLSLEEREEGLWFDARPPESRSDVVESIQRGDVRGNSFSFTVAEGGDEWNHNGKISVRTINEVDTLFDVGPVTFPAYPQTSVSARAIETAKQLQEAFESEGERGVADQLDLLRRKLALRERG